MPLYWPKRVLSSDTAPTPTLAWLPGWVSRAISSSRSSASAGRPKAASAAAITVSLSATPRRSAPERAFIGDVLRIVGAVNVGVAVQARARHGDADAGGIGRGR